MDPLIGDIVYSKAGRDKGKYFIVMATEGEYVYISNGTTRKSDKPKKKKTKHLKFGFGNSAYLHNKLIKGEKVTNTELRRELQEYNQQPETAEIGNH